METCHCNAYSFVFILFFVLIFEYRHKAINDKFVISNDNIFPVKYKIEPCFPREFQLSFSPVEGSIKGVNFFKNICAYFLPNRTKKR